MVGAFIRCSGSSKNSRGRPESAVAVKASVIDVGGVALAVKNQNGTMGHWCGTDTPPSNDPSAHMLCSWMS